MKKNLFTVMAFCASIIFTTVNAQEAGHVAKVNVTSLIYKNLSFQYEKPFTDKISVALGLRFQLPTTLPTIVDGTDDGTGSVDSRLSGYAITPEFRFYTGSKGAPKGFYLAPYLRYTKFNINTTSTYTEDNGTIVEYDLSGKFTGMGGGLMVGMQWLIADKFSIDWWIMGGHYGTATASVNGKNPTGTWSPKEQADMRAQLEADGNDLPFGTSDYSVTATEAQFNWHMPFLGLRPGLCLGWAF